MKIRLLVIASLFATVTGCRCGPGTQTNHPSYVALPKALNFEACPTKDSAGNPVLDVFPDEQTVKIHNEGKAGGGLKLTFTGDGAAAFSAKSPVPTAVNALETIDLPLLFSPTKKGVVKAKMLIDDEATDGGIAVDLVGTGSDLASQPTIVASVADVTGKYCNCGEVGCALAVCQQDFPDTLFKESASIEIKLTNSGCPGLNITGLEIIPYGAGNLAYFIDAPAVLPTAATPLVLTQSQNRQTTKIKIRFAPEDDGSGNLGRFATLRVKTNDPNARDGDNNVGGYDIVLSGTAQKPSLYTTPTRCDFNDTADTCGNATRIADKSNFEVKNDGNVTLKIESTTWKSNGSQTSNQDNRFAITSSIVGMTIPPFGSIPIEITHNQMPLYVLDLLTISATVTSGVPDAGPVSGGRAIISFAGGKKPCLSTLPAIDIATGQAKLDFAAPATELTAKQVTIKNGPAATCGDLIINGVSIDPNPFFTLIDPMIPSGTKIAPGTSLDATVQYKKPVSGGTQVGSLRIDSNDGAFASPPGYLVQLYSESPLDELPVAVLKGCLPADTTCAAGKLSSMSVNLSTLPDGPTAGTKLLLMYGLDSYDPPGTTKKVTNYQFRLVTHPTNAALATLENDGLKDPKSAVKLSLDGTATGLYRVTLGVFDDKNQASGTVALLQINVNQ